MDQIDWKILNAALDAIEGDVTELIFLDELDIERAKIDWLTFGLLNDSASVEVRSGMPFISPQNAKQQLALIVALAFGAFRTLGATELLPGFIIEHLRETPSDLALVKDGLRDRRITTEFLFSWGRLFAAHGAWQALTSDSSKQTAIVKGLEIERVNNRHIKEFWYAHWIHQHAPTLNANHLETAQQRLARLCIDIDEGRLQPWGPYPKNWYSTMLAPDRTKLTKRLLEISKEKILALCRDETITTEILPPLNLRGFSLAS